jgi:hypothetical protein
MVDTVFIDVGDSVFEAPPSADKAPATPPRRAERPGQKRTRKASGSRAQGPERATAGARARPQSSPVWLAGVFFALAIVAVALWWTQGRSTPRPVDDILTELKEPVSVPVAAAVASAASEQPVPANPASDVPPAGGIEKSAIAGAGGFGGAPAAAEAPAARPAARVAVQRRNLPEPPAAAPVVVQDIPAPPPEPVLAPKPKVTTVRTVGPQEACADASFLARPLCVFNECKKPGLTGHPVCVEARRRQEADEQRRQMQN